MKRFLLLAVVAVLALTSCSQSSSSSGSNTLTKTNAATTRVFSPSHTNVEIFIENFAGTGGGEAHSYPQFTGRTTFSVTNASDGAYAVSFEYRGTAEGQDFYWIGYTRPSGQGSVTAESEVAYSGAEKEIWNDSKYRIGIRPRDVNSTNHPASDRHGQR